MAHPLASGLLLSCLLDEGAGAKVYDGVQGKEFSITGGGWEGGAFSLRLATGSIVIAGMPCHINSTNKWSLVVRAKGAPYSAAVAPFISANFDAGVNYWALAKQQYTSQLYLRGKFNNYGDFVGGSFLSGGYFEQDAVETIVLTISGYNATVYRENGAVSTATLGASSDVTGTTIVVGNTANANYRGAIDSVQFYNRTLTADEAAALLSNPWQVIQPRIVRVPAAGGGGTSYTEPLTAILASVTSIDDRQTYQEAAAVLIQAGAAAEAVITMMEQVVALGQTETAATGLLTLAEQALATIQGAATLADAVTAAEALAATVISQTAVTDSQTSQGAEDLLITAQAATTITDVVTAVETLLATIQSATGVTDSSGGSPQTYPETLLVTATVAAEAGAAQSMVEALTVVAQGDVSVVDFRGYLEQVAATAQAIDSVSDRHLMIDNVTIMALSGAGLGEIGSYLEQVRVTAQAQASLADVLVTQFVGHYLFLDTLPLRSFTDRLPARSFTDTVRGRA